MATFSFIFLLSGLAVVGLVVTLLAVVAVNSYKSGSPPPPDLSDAQIYDLARNGKKLQAVKYYRQLHGVGLKEAKEAVEQIAP